MVNKVQKTAEKSILSQKTVPLQVSSSFGSIFSYFLVPSSFVSTSTHPVFPSPTASVTPSSSHPTTQVVVMAARYTPLVLPAQLHDLPLNYGQRLPQYDGTCEVIAKNHVDKVSDFLYL